VTDQRLTDELALKVLGWRPAPDRYLKPGRSWTPRAKFQPLKSIDDAFRLLERVTGNYLITKGLDQEVLVEIRLKNRVERSVGRNTARAVCFAVAKVVGIDLKAGNQNAPEALGGREPRS
jgi:hypothetical protein